MKSVQADAAFFQRVLRHLRRRDACAGYVTDDFEMIHDKGGVVTRLGRGLRQGHAGQVQAAGGWHRLPLDAQARAGEP